VDTPAAAAVEAAAAAAEAASARVGSTCGEDDRGGRSEDRFQCSVRHGLPHRQANRKLTQCLMTHDRFQYLKE
jgi:hypothetical protein